MQRDMSIIIPSKRDRKFNDRLGVTLNVIEKRHQGSESICDRIRAAVAIEDIQHFKTFPVETGPSVLEEKTKLPIPNSNPKLTLPIGTGLGV